jgi:hypothetical protein
LSVILVTGERWNRDETRRVVDPPFWFANSTMDEGRGRIDFQVSKSRSGAPGTRHVATIPHGRFSCRETDAMRLLWKIAAPVTCIAILFGAAISWHVYKTKMHDSKPAEDALACQARAEQGDAKAEYDLSRMYYYGQGVPRDYAETLRWGRKAADQGYAKAEYGIGYMYYYGQGVPLDYAEAAKWYRKAADHGDAIAQNQLGSMYYHGQGVQKDDAEAALWYRRAADKGYAAAEYNVGCMYYYGYGVPQDYAEAHRWFRKAANQGDKGARRALGIAWLGLTKMQLFFVLTQIVGGILLTTSIFAPAKSSSRFRQRIAPGAGILCIVSAWLSWYGYNHDEMRQSRYAHLAFLLTEFLLKGFLIVLLSYILRGEKTPPEGRTGIAASETSRSGGDGAGL